MRGGIRVSIAAPAVLLESTYLSVFVLDPVAVETLAPERTLRVLGIVPLSSAGETPEFVQGRKARGSRRYGGGSIGIPLTQPATDTMFGGPVRSSACLAAAGALAPFCRVAPPPTILTEGATGTGGGSRNGARLTEDENALTNEGARVGTGQSSSRHIAKCHCQDAQGRNRVSPTREGEGLVLYCPWAVAKAGPHAVPPRSSAAPG